MAVGEAVHDCLADHHLLDRSQQGGKWQVNRRRAVVRPLIKIIQPDILTVQIKTGIQLRTGGGI